MRAYLKENPNVAAEIEEKIRSILMPEKVPTKAAEASDEAVTG